MVLQCYKPVPVWGWADPGSEVFKPVAVRYAWSDNPEGCNLYNGAGLPASPFRTDNDILK